MTDALPVSPAPPEWLQIGRIVAPQGLRGELRVAPDSDFPERFLEPGRRWLLPPGVEPEDRAPQPVELTGGRLLEGKALFVVRLAGVGDRSAAEALRGSRLYVPASDRPTLEPGEFHLLDLVGLRVFDRASGREIGVVAALIDSAQDILEIRLTVPIAEAAPVEAEVAGGEPEAASSVASESESDAAAGVSPTGIPTATRQKSRRRSRRQSRKARRPAGPPTVLVPFVTAIVPVVDLAAGRLELDPPAGLLPDFAPPAADP